MGTLLLSFFQEIDSFVDFSRPPPQKNTGTRSESVARLGLRCEQPGAPFFSPRLVQLLARVGGLSFAALKGIGNLSLDIILFFRGLKQMEG